jgi:ubiquinone/menaquinone biosynthesis C-methylase UbiE
MTESRFPNPVELYEHFYGPGIFQPLSSIVLELAAPRSGEHVLDIACGTGLIARQVAPLVGKQGSVLAVDINPAMLAFAQSLPAPAGADIEWREADATTVDLPHSQFDLAICQQGLQFFSERAVALQRIRTCLKPGGRFVVAVWQNIEQQPLFAEFAKVEARYLAPLGVGYEDLVAPFSLGNPDELRDILSAAQFARIEIAPHSFEARFTSPDTFARLMETAYAAVIPAFIQDPDAFTAYVESVERETRVLVQQYVEGDTLRFPMPTNLAVAYA